MKIKLKKINCKKVAWSIYVFILIFAPPFMPYPHLALAVFSAILLATKYRKYWITAFKISDMKNWLIGMGVWVMYILVIPLPISLILNDIVDTSHYVSLFNRIGVLICTIIPCAGLMISAAVKEKWDYHFVIETVINAGILEGISSILAFLFPPIKAFFLLLESRFVDAEALDDRWYITVRSYGFSRTLVDLFGLGIALIAGVCLFYGITEKKKYILYSLVIAIATLLNARTGVVLYVGGVALAFGYLTLKGRIKAIFITLVGIAVGAVITGYVWNIIAANEATSEWITSGLNSLLTFLGGGGKNTGAIEALFRQNMELPGGLRTVLGTAHSLFVTGKYAHSDIGYINDIWLCGIVGCILLYGLIIKPAAYIWKNSSSLLAEFIAIYSLFCFFVFNFKGVAIGYNPGAVTLLLLLFVFRYFTYVKLKKRISK